MQYDLNVTHWLISSSFDCLTHQHVFFSTLPLTSADLRNITWLITGFVQSSSLLKYLHVFGGAFCDVETGQWTSSLTQPVEITDMRTFYDKPFNTCWEISVHILLMMRKTNKHQRSLHLFGFILWGISEQSNRSFINQKVSGFIPGFPSSACRSTLGEDTHLSPGVVRKYLEGSNCVGKIYLWPIYIWTDRNLHPYVHEKFKSLLAVVWKFSRCF